MNVTDDARAEAERRWPHGKYLDPLLYGLMKDKQRDFVAGAEWAAARAKTIGQGFCTPGCSDGCDGIHARPDTTEAQAQALEAAADRTYSEGIAAWLRGRAASIREEADR